MIKAFMTRFPEFTESMEDGDKELVMATLKAAEAELNPRIWGTLFEEGVLYLAADKLMRSRLGEALRDPDEPAAQSVYAIEFERLARIASMGARVL
ncbi:hypothetical protein E6Q11_04110 [Candidatus Dojkabacteria bacterium]|uniref:Uncharacterized protein n=1 Tax=Candidatus Dojkabacteria bacterium TaxID=2099670 RepID=A0A5C7J5Y4_9BACT|nr:MAG: hypothetical protein E6Q11_04110 [Candidatus Dojkabacteria bacterium]